MRASVCIWFGLFFFLAFLSLNNSTMSYTFNEIQVRYDFYYSILTVMNRTCVTCFTLNTNILRSCVTGCQFFYMFEPKQSGLWKCVNKQLFKMKVTTNAQNSLHRRSLLGTDYWCSFCAYIYSEWVGCWQKLNLINLTRKSCLSIVLITKCKYWAAKNSENGL